MKVEIIISILIFTIISNVLLMAPPPPTPTRPQLSEVFEAPISIVIIAQGQKNLNGTGLWAADQPHGKSYEHMIFEQVNTADDVVKVERYDINKTFTIDGNNPNKCNILNTTITMPTLWDWINSATFTGTKVNKGVQVAYWSVISKDFNETIGVLYATPNIPVEYRVSYNTFHTTFTFESWSITNINQTLFDIPTLCQ